MLGSFGSLPPNKQTPRAEIEMERRSRRDREIDDMMPKAREAVILKAAAPFSLGNTHGWAGYYPGPAERDMSRAELAGIHPSTTLNDLILGRRKVAAASIATTLS